MSKATNHSSSHSSEFNGKLIVVEGIEGAGKSTLIKKLHQHLQNQLPAKKVILTREPGGTMMGEQLRKILKHAEHPIDAYSELLLIIAARREHFNQVIQPNLDQGHWVLCDRFIASSYAYQGAGRRLGVDLVKKWHELVFGKFDAVCIGRVD